MLIDYLDDQVLLAVDGLRSNVLTRLHLTLSNRTQIPCPFFEFPLFAPFSLVTACNDFNVSVRNIGPTFAGRSFVCSTVRERRTAHVHVCEFCAACTVW